MKYRRIKNTDLTLSEIALGTWVFGSDMWGGSAEKPCIDVVKTALDCGINIIDTAPIYGNGRAETLVGRGIKGRRDKVLIATKCGLLTKGKQVFHDLSPKSIRKELDQSLKNLNIEYIDLYQCHWPDQETPIEETLSQLIKMKEAGKIRYFGVSNFDNSLLQIADGMTNITSYQGQFSILERDIETDVLPYAVDNDMGVLIYGVLAGGILSGKYTEPQKFSKSDVRSFFYKYYQGDDFQKVMGILTSLKDINKPYNQVAINFALQQRGVTSVIVGCRNPEQVRNNIKCLEWKLSSAQFEFINNARL